MKKSKEYQDFSGPLWCDKYADATEVLGALEQMANKYSKNPNDFDQAWLLPLLSEGLKMDRVCELILDGAIRPNQMQVGGRNFRDYFEFAALVQNRRFPC